MQYAKVAGLILGQGTYKSQTMHASVSGTTNQWFLLSLSLSLILTLSPPPSSFSLKSINTKNFLKSVLFLWIVEQFQRLSGNGLMVITTQATYSCILETLTSSLTVSSNFLNPEAWLSPHVFLEVTPSQTYCIVPCITHSLV